MPTFVSVTSCRMCGEQALRPVLDFGEQYVVDFVQEKDENLFRAPLVLGCCEKCNLVQLMHSVDKDRLYRKFWYRSGTNESMKEALRNIVEQVTASVYVGDGDRVLDVGCNDGELLGWYTSGLKTIGIDPCAELVEEGLKKRRLDIGIKTFFSAEAVRPYAPYKVITAVAMFYDLEDPVQFLKDCRSVLKQDGVLVVQMNYLGTMLGNYAVDNVCHEHLTYFSMSTFEECVKRAGLEVAGAEMNDVNGGSFRVYLTHQGSGLYALPVEDQIRSHVKYLSMLHEEKSRGLNRPETYSKFGTEVLEKCELLQRYLTAQAEQGEKIYLYGASTRGTVLMQMLNLCDGVIRGVAERDKNKWGLRMVGGCWPEIYSEEDVRKEATQMLLLPWHYLDQTWKREENWLKNGGKLIVPLPEPRVLTWDGKKENISDVMSRRGAEVTA